jgi:voltage-gated potassium channel Kch
VTVSSSDLLYDTLQLFWFKGGELEWSYGYVLALDVARWAAIIVIYWAMVLILARAFVAPLRKLRLWLCSDHVVVCGADRIGSRFAKTLSKDYQVVVVVSDQSIGSLGGLRDSGVLILQGNAEDEKVLRSAGIDRARFIIPSMGEDSANAEVAIQARRMVEGRSRDPLTCFLHVMDPELCEVLRVNEYNAGNPSMRLEFYNIFENGARTILNEFPAFQEGSIGTLPSTRILVIGLDEVGQGLVVRAVKRWWSHYQATNQRLSLVLVDKDVDSVLKSMRARYPDLDSACTFECIAMDIHMFKVAKDEELNRLNSMPPSYVYICAPDDSDGLSLALMVRRRLGNEGAPIVVRLNADSKPAALLGEEGRNAGLSNIYTFGFWERTCTEALIQYGSREVLGQAIHEEYCLEQQAQGNPTQASKTPWDDLSEELRESNRAQADHIIAKAKAIGCRIDTLTDWGSDLYSLTPYEVHKLSRLEHDRWCQEKTRKGWRYGKVRDDAMKVHDDLRPWVELSADAKYKDIATVTKIPMILARVDLRLARKDMTLSIGKALLMDKMSQASRQKDGNVDVSSAWRGMLDVERTRYLDEAKAMIDCLGEIDCGISGRGSVEEELVVLGPAEAERANLKYRSLMADKGEDSFAGEASTWPKVLSTMDMAIFRYEDARKLMEGDREAMIMAFGPGELEEPFLHH